MEGHVWFRRDVRVGGGDYELVAQDFKELFTAHVDTHAAAPGGESYAHGWWRCYVAGVLVARRGSGARRCSEALRAKGSGVGARPGRQHAHHGGGRARTPLCVLQPRRQVHEGGGRARLHLLWRGDCVGRLAPTTAPRRPTRPREPKMRALSRATHGHSNTPPSSGFASAAAVPRNAWVAGRSSACTRVLRSFTWSVRAILLTGS